MTADEPGTEDSARWIRAALERFERPLTAYATRLLGDVERARDAVQETFLRLCKERPDEIDERLSEWLYTVCRNLCLDVRRKESRMSSMNEAQAGGIAHASASATAAAEVRDSASHVLRVLAELPEKQQEVLRLKFQNGLSYKEIARVMDESVGNVGWLIHVGIKSLRGKLAGEGAEA